MCRATNYKKTAIGGCLLLLQSWAWFRMPFLCPIVNEPYVFPLLLRAMIIFSDEIMEGAPPGTRLHVNSEIIDHYIPLTLKRNITVEELITKISLKIRVAGQRRLSSLQYRFPTELFPLTYTSFQLSNDDDVSMMVDAHMGSSQSLIEMYATFIEVRVTRGLSYSSHFGIAYQTDQVDSPTQLICNDFTSLMADPTPYTMPSSSIGRHSSATAYDLNPRGFTNNPYGNISSTSRGRHSSANVFDLHMEMPTRRQSIHIPHDTMASSSRGGHASGNLFDLNIGLSEEPSSPPEEPLREPGADGAETGLFVEPDSPQFNVHSDDDEDDVPINTTLAELPAHMYEADYDAMYEPEFPDLPDVGNYGLQSSVNDGNLHIGMEFASKEEAMMAIKSYNIRNSVQSRVDRSNTEKYVCYCVQRHNGCQWMVRVSKRKRKNNLWELTKYNGPHTCCATVLISAIQSQYGYTVSYKKAWLAKQNAICKLHGEWDSSYNELPSWFHVVQRLNPGTIVEFETQHHYVNDRMVRDRCQFYRVFWTYPQCINAVKYYGNRNILPVAFALVQGEDTESWAFFLKNLRLHVVTRERVCIISDRGAGIKAAMDSLGTMYRPPHVQHRYCVRHIAANYYGKYKKNDERQLVVRMGVRVHYGHQQRNVTNAYDGGYRYGHMTTNLAEAINSTLKGARYLPVTALVKTTYFRLGQLFAKLGGQALTWMQNGHIYHPRLVADLQKKMATSNGMLVTNFSRTRELFRVTEMPRPLQGIEANSFRVNLQERWCDCGFFQALKYPCSHVIAACSHSHLDYKNYVDPVYQLSQVFKVYEFEFPPIGNERDPNEIQTWLTIVPDPLLLRDSGRPNLLEYIVIWIFGRSQQNKNDVGIVETSGTIEKNVQLSPFSLRSQWQVTVPTSARQDALRQSLRRGARNPVHFVVRNAVVFHMRSLRTSMNATATGT
ncbi:hypothetical protein F3Y22_tig00110162pilonHSYRG00103 [Hibiscus syriacus]|uniref:SWIM-type domain-containing protein n=1 Tax=Hibiscus syriacus TaxID=106335 RepID=A0A6A3BG06_HIBSY|nr:hypothetical protein F3Y22_tig00110162pilonHSYRG00103 [Hibiscus syriacus]